LTKSNSKSGQGVDAESTLVHDGSDFVQHMPCEKCGSSDGNALYSDGHTHCFVCKTTVSAAGIAPKEEASEPKTFTPVEGVVQALPKRGLSEDVCRKYSYSIGKFYEDTCHIANYYRDGKLVAQKLRFSKNGKKAFKFLTEGNNHPFFGQHLFREGKLLVVTEGEIDCLSVAQVMQKTAVVSVPNGADSSVKACKRNLEWLEGFATVVFCFDMDEPGQSNAKECAALLSPGKARIAHLPRKDPNEMLIAGQGGEIIKCVLNAREYRPDGIISGSDTWELFMKKRKTESIPYPWKSVNGKTRGLRLGEMVTLTAGTGIGKSTFCRELAYYLETIGQRIGYMALEESAGKTTESFLSLELDTPLHLTPDVPEDLLHEAWDRVMNNDRFYLYDHWGSTDIDVLLKKMKFLVVSCGCKWIFLDHISIVVSGISEGEERRLIDNIMTKLRTFVEANNIGLIIVSHLKKLEGNKGHEDGEQVRLSHLRGSGAIAQLSDISIALERDQQSEEGDADVSAVRILKNRFSGETGITGYLQYDKVTGRLIETDRIINDASKVFAHENEDF
jgi:twinkle protein